MFPSSQYHRLSEVEPYTPHFEYEDQASLMYLDAEATSITTEKGFRMARAYEKLSLTYTLAEIVF